MEEDLLSRVIWSNTYRQYMWAALILLGGYLFARYTSKPITRILFTFFRKFSHNAFSEEFVLLVRKPLSIVMLLIIINLAFHQLQYPDEWHLADGSRFGVKLAVRRLFQISMVVSLTWVVLRISDFIATVFIRRKAGNSAHMQLILFVKELSKITLAIFSLFFILGSIFRMDITSLVAGLGIGGLAVALAAQETIANLIGSFVIFFDNPFVVGDFVETPEIKGTVERVGFRSTRIRTLDKTLLTVPNKKLVDSALNNITRSEIRRVRITASLSHETSIDQLRNILKEMLEVLQKHPDISDDATANFSDFEKSSLNITLTFHVRSSDGDYVVRVKEEINFRLLEVIEKNGCRLAIPTSTVYLQNPLSPTQ
jgi:MscS family membrane protein